MGGRLTPVPFPIGTKVRSFAEVQGLQLGGIYTVVDIGSVPSDSEFTNAAIMITVLEDKDGNQFDIRNAKLILTKDLTP